MVAIEVSSNQWAHLAARAPPGNVQRRTCTHGKTQMVCREISHHVYKKRFHVVIVTGKWTRPQDLPLILTIQLEDASWSYKLQLAKIGGSTTKPGCPHPSPISLRVFLSFTHSLGSTVSLLIREDHSQIPWRSELSQILRRSQAIHNELITIKYCSCSRCTEENWMRQLGTRIFGQWKM